MPGAESIVRAFRPFGKAAHALIGAQRIKEGVIAPGQKLMHIGLVPHIPNNFILRGVKSGVQRQG